MNTERRIEISGKIGWLEAALAIAKQVDIDDTLRLETSYLLWRSGGPSIDAHDEAVGFIEEALQARNAALVNLKLAIDKLCDATNVQTKR